MKMSRNINVDSDYIHLFIEILKKNNISLAVLADMLEKDIFL